MEVKIEGKELVVRVPIVHEASKSGKSIIVASSHGNQATTAIIDGKPVIVGFNAYQTCSVDGGGNIPMTTA